MLWQCNVILENNCTPKASLKQCQVGNDSLSYFGGRHECAKDSAFTKSINVSLWHDQVTTAKITGKVWVIDSWETENITLVVRNSKGKELNKTSFRGNA